MPTQSEISISPISAKGDIISSDGSSRVRVPVGTNGQVLSSNSTATSGLLWIDPSTVAAATVEKIYSTTLTATATSITISFSADTATFAFIVEGMLRCTRTSVNYAYVTCNTQTNPIAVYTVYSDLATAGWQTTSNGGADYNQANTMKIAYNNATLYDASSFTPFMVYLPNGTNASKTVGTQKALNLAVSGSAYDGTTTGTSYGDFRMSSYGYSQSIVPNSINIYDTMPASSALAIGTTIRVYKVKKI